MTAGVGSLKARWRKTAIWALVTGWWGQNLVPSVLHPVVIPALATLLMESSKTCESVPSSLK